MPIAVIALGSNSEDKHDMISRARMLINIFIGPVVNKSSVYLTSPWGMKDQDDFYNQTLEVHTVLNLKETFQNIQTIESVLKKEKSKDPNGPRNIDIDLLFFDDEIYDSEDIKVPHPRMHLRNFVLIPLNEMTPEFVHPILKKSISELATACEDSLAVKRLNSQLQ